MIVNLLATEQERDLQKRDFVNVRNAIGKLTCVIAAVSMVGCQAFRSDSDTSIASFSLIINAPNAIRKDLAGAPFSVGKFAAYSDSNSDHGIIWAIFTQRLSADKLPPKGSSNSDGGLGASSTFLYTIAGGDARLLIYFTCLFCTLPRSRERITFRYVKCDRYIQQALS